MSVSLLVTIHANTPLEVISNGGNAGEKNSLHVSATITTTISPPPQPSPQYGYLIVSALLSAASVAYHFFRILFSSIWKLIMTLLWPVSWLVRLCWTGLVVKPAMLFAHICYVLWPITLFCLMAVLCGLVIGGCAGFAAEAFSSVLISATWGGGNITEKQKSKDTVLSQVSDSDIDVDADIEDDERDAQIPEPPGSDHTGYTGSSARMPRGYPLAAMIDEDEDDENLRGNKSSSSSFYWETSFFGGNRRGKERRGLPDATVESWRSSLSRRSSSSSTSSQIMINSRQPPVNNAAITTTTTTTTKTTAVPVFATSMSMSVVPPPDNNLKKRTTYNKQDDWEWADDDEDDFPSRRNSR
ncbi:hypothetical protein PHYBLDRAFT_166706 [Phycomyces blakesleeanus NRRL 1555(-)]|uniref:Uncharacterized protein n=2 Tax=Phycomyces blakesleeanus TaxID=4837 RepID=A0A167NA91_PHYB8|nr:hypothetical protein PHYBLDRAFT_166706 [Phycomyces blakesleeanus NRRL 1555(-)]OAD75470.1 hypothetical protein PHYBLDRAFT_166706 [Phycomyces blakesleeanus NRRL 1555(-)]|eukprot:XP_018293510.1 hypothetical protein PHYBLDRAFT_166706 [Phycomyces blakesleeanus NRRL 1555(-)]